jgi:hypothetical protein
MCGGTVEKKNRRVEKKRENHDGCWRILFDLKKISRVLMSSEEVKIEQ